MEKQSRAEYYREYRKKRVAQQSDENVANATMQQPEVQQSVQHVATSKKDWKSMNAEEWNEYKKDKCIFCFGEAKMYHRRYGPVWLCDRHGFEGGVA